MVLHKLLLVCLASVAGILAPLTSVTPASTSSPPASWAIRSATLHQDPAAIVRTSPSTVGMQVVVTTETSSGPRITSLPAPTVAAAQDLVEKAQAKDSTIAVSMAQDVAVEAVNDPKRPSQWALNTLAADTCWAKTTGAGVIVAVVDSGVRATNPDLKGRVLPGYDVVTDKPQGNVATDGHGTHVAGIIAANANNRLGVAGLSPQATILPVRVADAKGASNSGSIAKGVVWATNHGAQVINISMGGDGRDPSLDTAVQYAVAKDVIVVAAAGNEKKKGNKTHYPAGFANVIGVGATDSKNRIAPFSNTGSYVDVTAPGVDIWSTYTSPAYLSLSGTSMASPYVAATAALAIAARGPGYSAATIRAQILATAKDLGPAGPDATYGAGLVSPSSLVAVEAGGRLASKVALTVPTTPTQSGAQVAVGGRLTTTQGAGLPGRPVAVSATYGGVTVTRNLTTDSAGKVRATFAPTARTTFRLQYSGDPISTPGSYAATYALVTPRMKIERGSRTVTLTSYSLFGQNVQLQKRSGDSWRTVSQKPASEGAWVVKLTPGTYRVHTVSNGSVMAWTSGSWSSA